MRFNTTTQQLVELRLKGVEAEDFLSDHQHRQLKRLEAAVLRTFPGRGVNPYLFNILPEFEPDRSAEQFAPRYYQRPKAG